MVAWFFWTNHNSLLRIATNEIASFFIHNILRQMAFFVFAKVSKGRLSTTEKDFEIKKAEVVLLYNTNRFHVAKHLFSIRSQRTSKCGKNIRDTISYRLVGPFFVLATFSRHQWFITEKTQSNMASICWIETRRTCYIFFLEKTATKKKRFFFFTFSIKK